MSKRALLASATLAVILSLAGQIRVGPSAAGAAVLEVPLPDLIGLYADGIPTVSTQFNVPINPAAILSASVRLHGDLPWPSYTTSCGYNGIIFSLEVPAATGVWEARFYVDQRFNFQVNAQLLPTGGATWDFLAGGQGSISCRGDARPLPPGCNYIHGGCCPMGDVTYASITFEYDPIVPVEDTTWGRIKALYK